jgi:hypothetical protein
VTRTGGIKLNYPGLDPDELPETCALDIAEHGGLPLEVVAVAMNLTRERVRQILSKLLDRVRGPLHDYETSAP